MTAGLEEARSDEQLLDAYSGVVRFHALGQASGVLVISIEDGGAGRKAGLQEGDVLIGLGNDVIGGVDDLQRILT